MRLVNLVDRADVWVVQRGCSFGFPPEAAKSLRIVREDFKERRPDFLCGPDCSAENFTRKSIPKAFSAVRF
jgi:hypothetical protein